MKNLSVRFKILLSFALVCVVVIAAGFMVQQTFSDLSGNIQQMAGNAQGTTDTREMQASLQQAQSITGNAQRMTYTATALIVILSVGLGLYLSKSITWPLKELTNVTKGISKGHVNQTIRYTSKDEMGQLAQALRQLLESITEQAACAERIAEGDFKEGVPVRSEEDILNQNFNQMLKNLAALSEEASSIVYQARKGNLTVRGKADQYKGGWKDLIGQLNDLVEAIEGPVTYVSGYIQNMANGQPLQMIVPANETDLAYEDLLTGEQCQAYRNTYNGQFGAMIDDLSHVRSSLYNMLGGAIQLTQCATEGDLSYRADTSSLQGGWAAIIGGFNKAIDVMIEPVEEAADVLMEMSEGNLRKRVTGDYKGDHNKIKTALNTAIDTQRTYIDEITAILQKMADGDMTQEITADYKGDFTAIKVALNRISDSLNNILSEISGASVQVASGASQVAEAAQRLSVGASAQSSTLEEITTTMTDISRSTQINAEHAVRAQRVSNTVHGNAMDGNAQMKDMLTAMEEINTSSTDISKIIKVIDEIAYQTNILALNAAVEAARAGEHGKGFAVVAEEVRNLAARSAHAAKETTALIHNSIEKVKDGTTIALTTSEALDQIVAGIGDTTEIIAQIADASAQQSTAIVQINEGLSQVTGTTQENAAASQESAAASEEMASQADLLKDMISTFTLKEKTAPVVSPMPATNQVPGIQFDMPVIQDQSYTEEKISSVKEAPKRQAMETVALESSTVVPVEEDLPQVNIPLEEEDFGKY